MGEYRSQRLQVVVDMADRAENQAASEFEHAKHQLIREQEQLAELKDYYQDYQSRFASQSSGLRASQLSQSRHFLQRLADAIQGQQQQVERAQLIVDQKRDEWNKVHLKHKSLTDLVERYRHEEHLALEKKEQKLLDEWSLYAGKDGHLGTEQ